MCTQHCLKLYGFGEPVVHASAETNRMNGDEFEGHESTALLLWRHTVMGHEVAPSGCSGTEDASTFCVRPEGMLVSMCYSSDSGGAKVSDVKGHATLAWSSACCMFALTHIQCHRHRQLRGRFVCAPRCIQHPHKCEFLDKCFCGLHQYSSDADECHERGGGQDFTRTSKLVSAIPFMHVRLPS
jgi:hypothetical protein